ncbi:hypothetical protein WA026_021409 [Henosepilachna vigintioctopunctata]|uniref:Uncharacterized protein n=1 Tax=Henosepilachna vigintioctopunctata TaxID=420089 RepID=A0AAW1TNS5_9CUCU
MTSEQSHQLFLVDEANKKSYTLTVSLEEYEKASIDPDYGGILLVEHLKAGRAIRMEDIQIQDNCIGESCNDENVPVNHQSDQPFRAENVGIEDEPLDVSCHKNRLDTHQKDQESTAYNWKEDETFLLIECYRKEGIHLLVRKPDISAALQKCVSTFNSILLEKKGKTVPFSKCSSKIDSLKRIYREKLDLKNKSGGASITWTYFEVISQEILEKLLVAMERKIPYFST